jgi:hypothetical protein
MMDRTSIRAIVCLAAACALTPFDAAQAQAPDPKSPREALIQALEALIATGEPEHITHDLGHSGGFAVDCPH